MTFVFQHCLFSSSSMHQPSWSSHILPSRQQRAPFCLKKIFFYPRFLFTVPFSSNYSSPESHSLFFHFFLYSFFSSSLTLLHSLASWSVIIKENRQKIATKKLILMMHCMAGSMAAQYCKFCEYSWHGRDDLQKVSRSSSRRWFESCSCRWFQRNMRGGTLHELLLVFISRWLSLHLDVPGPGNIGENAQICL